MSRIVFGRQIGQRIFIGDDIVIDLAQDGRGCTRIGVTAPDNIRVDREEVRREREKMVASGGGK